MAGGFSSLPKVTALVRRKTAAARALPPSVPATDVQFDEDRRLILTEPLRPLPAAPATVAPPGGFTRISNPPPKLPAYTGPAKRPAPAKDAPGYSRNSDGVWQPRPLRPGEKPTLTPDMIPF
jgi:hypothetical protein